MLNFPLSVFLDGNIEVMPRVKLYNGLILVAVKMGKLMKTFLCFYDNC